MVRETIRLIPGAIACGLLRPMRLLWIPVGDSDPGATADSVLQIRVRVCSAPYETHNRSNDMTLATCAAEPAP
jgi:hypothetical protein